ncbi:proline-rich family protein [Forsythia ovata]|uniref:Proline-rich family protein n=1 Tax=Forsythia ovata TaxID=205694 RepID=A0ABD1QQG8_9LAMI
MALSTTPPPPDPPATTATPPLFLEPGPPNSQPLPFYPPPFRLPSNPNPNYPQLASRPLHPQDPAQILYPVASSGRGFVPGPVPVTMPTARTPSRPPFVFPHPDPGQLQDKLGYSGQIHLLASRPSSAANGGGGVMPGVVKGIPISSFHRPKVGSSSTSISDGNGYKDLRDRSRDDTLEVIRDRKVKASHSASLYTLCRSWLRNGFPEETQPQYLDTLKSLPRPLPIAAQDSDSPGKREDKQEEDEDEGSVEHLSTKELLQRHIKHSKRVRSRLREERLQRISRYKTRLALLIPPMVEQHLKN